jgi:AcrR family transcriptional regulator
MELNEKQHEILIVAEKLFAEKGFDGTSVRDISKNAGVNVAMISYYFGSKEKLLEQLILVRVQDLKIKLTSLFNEEIDPFEKINRFIELYIQKIDANRHMYKIMHFEIASKKRALDLSGFNAIKKTNLHLLTKIITEGQNQKLFKKNINIALITPTILGTYFHFYTNRHYFDDILNLTSDLEFDNYIKNELTHHIQFTIKSLLQYEN